MLVGLTAAFPKRNAELARINIPEQKQSMLDYDHIPVNQKDKKN